MSNKALKKLAKECIFLNDVYDECDECGRPTLLHKEEECTRDVDEGLKVVAKNWRDLRRRLKPILKEIQEERRREAEQTVYLDGIERLIKQIALKDSSPKTGVRDGGTSTSNSASSDGGTARMAKLMKPVKVPTLMKDLTLETYAKQLHTWSDILEDYPE